MKRSVLLTIDDDRVEELWVREQDADGHLTFGKYHIPVPPDDQLTRDAIRAVGSLEAEAAHERIREHFDRADALDASAARLRAAFHLDEEE